MRKLLKGYMPDYQKLLPLEREYVLYYGGRVSGEALGNYIVRKDEYNFIVGVYPDDQLIEDYGLRVRYTQSKGMFAAIKRALKRGTGNE